MGLAEYKRKRHFSRTPEPKARKARKAGWSYVVQKHQASHLHYDFRLELDGVLKSWAVPKGPSLDPAVKRLAVHVEDHPVDYGGFEGVIPEGEYGGGIVMLWDQGHWEPVGDPHDGYRKGKLKFLLHGEKLTGGWMLVRSGRARSSGEGREWLLFKERDEAAHPADERDILEDSPLSVASGRDLDAIASARDRVWSSKSSAKTKAKAAPRRNGRTPRTAAPRKLAPRKAAYKPRKAKTPASDATGAEKHRLPAKVEVELATLTKEAPEGDGWIHEIKFDGYRMICRIDGDRIEFISRNQQKWTSRFGALVEAVKELGIKQAILDGEVVAMQPDGTTSFQALQNAFRGGGTAELQYYAFDLLYLDGYSLVETPLDERKQILSELLADAEGNRIIRYSEHVVGAGADFAREACKLHLEGIISKRRDRPYRGGRGSDWLKIKCVKNEEFVIGGFTDPSGSRAGFGALLVGYYDTDGKLVYAGKVGTGFNAATLRSLLDRLKPLVQDKSPFSNLTRRTGPARTAHWVEPVLVAQIAYGNRTSDGFLRHASFQGLREDKAADEVTLDQAIPVTEALKRSRAARKRRAPPSMTGHARKTPPAHASKTRPATTASAKDYDSRKEEFAGVRLTSPEKLLYPDEGITKLELAEYYREIAEWILPHLSDRPLVLVRCPEGRAKACFYQKHPGVGTPDSFRQIPVREKNKTENYVVVDDVAGLISVAQVGALEIHAWGSRADNLERPDRLVFDLDPDPEVPWKRVVESARQMRDFLQALGLESFLKTTGGKGLHLVVPIDRRHGWDEAKSFCKLVADTIVAVAPGQYTANMSKAARPGKIFIDYLRNGRGATAIVPYSTRARAGATVSTPLTWKELSARITSDHFDIRNVRRRLKSLRSDPWEGISSVRQGLAAPLKKLRAPGR